ncbi:hypothetical protein LPJ78_002541 [Coemansia sp. RSA 989]|nr:hypothetical protein BX667DRAFT_521812 [Coemansia mojavensis]KAJ1741094.1 hypothetical protein LPJ68_003167 [Coemansia sp. RSA 1086]KAJ1749348.1 hypothetical protein LPJ79_003791 [Coemansia sp. RSA 1821]KAJ1865612.1 hypothetical protein LPJ78_002541 [Coemansia sp. RSA 989]KAJ1872797.1 hypothetical protein LPJ55_002794 [Coemansia sp. RSA 990]KAJ2648016.1 hypothetical protein IWW40_004220 [Coemansia sp. RSA 1250]KAJ2672758.1 hypothetical protein IWW42_002711 [Coemansia sp. RSA 1085]
MSSSQETHKRTDPAERPDVDKIIKKRKPLRPSNSRADIYVTRDRRKFSSFMLRARKLLAERNYPSITIHGLGAAIPTAIKVAAATKTSLGDQVQMETSTHTVTLYDDIAMKDGSSDVSTQARQNSAVQIKMSLDPKVRSQIFAKPRRGGL